MSSSTVSNSNNQNATNELPANPFSDWKSTTNLDPNNTTASNLPNELATLIFSKMAIDQVQVIMENTKTQMERYSLYRNLVSAKSSLTGTELEKFQRLLSMEGRTPVHKEIPMEQSRITFLTGLIFSAYQYWTGNTTNQDAIPLTPLADLLTNKKMFLSELQQFDLSDSTNITDADLIALAKECKKLTKLILPGAFPSDEVMAVLKANCPQAAIYPSAMTEQEWRHPAAFMKKLPPLPQEIKNFINGPRPIWPGKTASQAHRIVPRVNKIVRNINGRSVMVPWTMKNVSKLDKATGRDGIASIWNEVLIPANDKPPEVGFEWVVFTKDVLPESRNQSYANQKQLIKHWGYGVPGFLDATTCMLWENRISGNRIYNDNPCTFTRCREMMGGFQFTVGYFSSDGVTFGIIQELCSTVVGIGGLKKFKI